MGRGHVISAALAARTGYLPIHDNQVTPGRRCGVLPRCQWADTQARDAGALVPHL